MNKKIFDLMDDVFGKNNFDSFNTEKENIHVDKSENSPDKTAILNELVKFLDGDDIVYLLHEWMKNNKMDNFAARTYDESHGSKLIHFRLEAEYGYYLDELEGNDDV